jgi:hypothetical protein
MRCRVHRSLPRRIEQVHLSMSSLSVLPSPVNGRVGIRDFAFEAFSSFTHVAACQIARPPKSGLCPEAPTQPVTRLSRSVATMLINNYMDGSFPHWRTAPLRRTVNRRIRRRFALLSSTYFRSKKNLSDYLAVRPLCHEGLLLKVGPARGVHGQQSLVADSPGAVPGANDNRMAAVRHIHAGVNRVRICAGGGQR